MESTWQWHQNCHLEPFRDSVSADTGDEEPRCSMPSSPGRLQWPDWTMQAAGVMRRSPHLGNRQVSAAGMPLPGLKPRTALSQSFPLPGVVVLRTDPRTFRDRTHPRTAHLECLESRGEKSDQLHKESADVLPLRRARSSGWPRASEPTAS